MADTVYKLLMDTTNKMNHLHYERDGSSF
jgi:hypothetical protein